MKVSLLPIAALFLSLATADRYIVTFEDASIPSAAYNKVKKYVTSTLGGKINHEYTIFRGFTVDFSNSKALTSSQIVTDALGGNLGYGLHVEKDAYVFTYADS